MQASAAELGDLAPADDVPPPLISDFPQHGRRSGRRAGRARARARARARSRGGAEPGRAPMFAVPPDGLGWSDEDVTELGRTAPGLLPGRILKCDRSGAQVLTTTGAARATFCAALLLASARARAAGRTWPHPGDRVALRRWPDGPITVEGVVV
jgi:hypothetical protein